MTANEGVGILKTDKDWLLQVQRKFALDKSIILGWLDSFCNDCNCRGKQQHENLADVKQHFIDWMSKQLNSKNNKNTCKEKVIKRPDFFAKLVKSRTIPLFFHYFCTPIF